MIDFTLKFLTEEINNYLSHQPGLIMGDLSLVMGNASRIFDTDTAAVDVPMNNKAIISLVNVEEDRLSRHQDNVVRTAEGVVYAEPPVLLNLYVLFIMNLKNQEAALRWLSCIIRFFQHQPYFTPLSHPSLHPTINHLSVSLHSMSFEQSNQLWSMLGGKYLPSVLYKIRQVSIDEQAVTAGGGFIKNIVTNGLTKQPVL